MHTRSFLVIGVLVLSGCQQPIVRIAFGSCAQQDQPQPIWDAVVESRPDLFIFLGDNIYADTDDMAVMRGKYAQLAAQPGYRRLRQTCPILATWDDHDYGRDDAGADYELRSESQKEFADFFGLPGDSPRRTRPGVFGSYTFGPAGRRVQVILLDTRFNRSPLTRRDPEERKRLRLGPYVPTDETSTTVLGEEQWRWLEEQLHRPAEVRVIASSIQVVSREHGWETWGNFPHERSRLFELIRKTRASGVVFFSGDRHMTELSRTGEGPYPLYDLTSSGMNMRQGGRRDEPNEHRLLPMNQGNNFGTITLHWDSPGGTMLTLRSHDLTGEILFEQTVPLAELQAEDDGVEGVTMEVVE